MPARAFGRSAPGRVLCHGRRGVERLELPTQFTEQCLARGSTFRVTPDRPGLIQQRCEPCGIKTRFAGQQLLQRRLTLGDQPPAPGFDAAEARPILRAQALACRQYRLDRGWVDLAHQLADVLALACQAAASIDPLRELDRLAQDLGQRQRIELGGAQADQALAQILGGVGCALAHALARRRGRRIKGQRVIPLFGASTLAHGWSPALLRRWIGLRGAGCVGGTLATVARCYNSARAAQEVPGVSSMSQTVDASRIAELESVVQLALQEARQLGASQAEADASLQKGLNATVRLGEVETVEYQRDRGLGITVYFGRRKGSASTADFAATAVRESVAKACSIARYTAEDACAGLADPDELAREFPDLQLDFNWSIEPDAAVALAQRCEAAGRAVDSRLANSEGATVSTGRGVRVYGNSHGFLAGQSSSSHSLSCVLIAQQGEDMQRDYWYTSARDPADLEDADVVGRIAGARAVGRLGARRLPTQKAPVLLAPEVARGLIGHFIGAISGGSQYRKSTFLLGAAGQQVFPSWMQMHERPYIRKGLASGAWDSEGVRTRDRELVQGGVVEGYLLGSYSARKLGLRSTGNAGGLHNLLVDPSPGALDATALLRTMGRGLLVTELMGQGVNGVTGDYSRGATGFWIEGGEIAWPVHEVTIAGNLKDMYRSIAAIGSDIDVRGGIRVGSLLLEQMTIAGE